MSEGAGPAAFGRVDPDGTVYVRTRAGERSVGQVPGVPAEEALAFFIRRYEALELEVSLLETRIASQTLSPDDALGSIKTVRAAVSQAHAVGDLDGLVARLDALIPIIAEHRAERRAERARQSQEARDAKERYVLEAERLAAGNDWRGGVNRFRALLEEWKALPRLDRATDDALWHRFSSARTTYTRRRKAQFAQQAEQRETARLTKERLVAEAEELATSTDWAAGTSAYRDLMSSWKAAGPAPRETDELLWKRFRAAQDMFFAARQAAQSAQDSEFRQNLRAKEALLAEGEQLLPVTDVTAAKAAYRTLLERWNAIGKVPRESIRPLENRLRAIEKAISAAEDERWRRNNPEARARAEDTAAKLEAQIIALEDKAARAKARGDQRAAQEAVDSAATYREWLAQA
ncbi:MAG: hypothetical protein K0S98_1895, partial [Propionibacteriaceae bacterium]|nr:hypothetical protein [Propionibacteriaceae bacterium]